MATLQQVNNGFTKKNGKHKSNLGRKFQFNQQPINTYLHPFSIIFLFRFCSRFLFDRFASELAGSTRIRDRERNWQPSKI
jgi:hypothetical protein